MKKLKVNTDGCIGCGTCVALDDEHFTFNEDGFCIVKSDRNIDEDKMTTIINACPPEVIFFEEDSQPEVIEEENAN